MWFKTGALGLCGLLISSISSAYLVFDAPIQYRVVKTEPWSWSACGLKQGQIVTGLGESDMDKTQMILIKLSEQKTCTIDSRYLSPSD